MSSDPIFRDERQEPTGSRYQALLDSEFTGVYTCDSSGVITYYNKQAADWRYR